MKCPSVQFRFHLTDFSHNSKHLSSTELNSLYQESAISGTNMEMAGRRCSALLILRDRVRVIQLSPNSGQLYHAEFHENSTNSLMTDSVTKGWKDGRGLHIRRSLSLVKDV